MSKPILELAIGEKLRRLNLFLSTAESCTGGMIGHLLTNIPGSSEYYLGGVIAYANQIKVQLLNVNPLTLENYGAVSPKTVAEMARGVRQLFQSDIGLSVSGIAGPTGGTNEKPIGLVWIGLSTTFYENTWSFNFPGSRIQVKQQASQMALDVLNNYLNTRKL